MAQPLAFHGPGVCARAKRESRQHGHHTRPVAWRLRAREARDGQAGKNKGRPPGVCARAERPAERHAPRPAGGPRRACVREKAPAAFRIADDRPAAGCRATWALRAPPNGGRTGCHVIGRCAAAGMTSRRQGQPPCRVLRAERPSAARKPSRGGGRCVECRYGRDAGGLIGPRIASVGTADGMPDPVWSGPIQPDQIQIPSGLGEAVVSPD